MTSTSHNPPRLFLSYSHRDEKHKDELLKHLTPLTKNGSLVCWDDRKLVMGEALEESLRSELTRADLVVFLVSSDFIASTSCFHQELEAILERRKFDNVPILPVIIRDCVWEDTPFAQFVAAPTDGKPVTRFSNRDVAWTDIANKIKEAVKQWQTADGESPKGGGNTGATSTELVPKFCSWLTNMELTLQHRVKDKLELPDIFVYPDIREANYYAYEPESTNSSKLLSLDFLGDGVVIQGDEQTGKTSLTKMIFDHYHQNKVLPLYANAKEVSSSNPKDALGKFVSQQYRDMTWDSYISSAQPRMLIMDDFHTLKLNTKYQEKFLETIKEIFAHVLLVANTSMNFDEKRMATVAAYPRWEILDLGYARRGELIDRWNKLGQEETINMQSLHRKNDEVMRNVNSIVRKNVLPSKPIFVLTIIQTLDLAIQENFELTSYGHCYHALIVHALHKVGVKAQKFDMYVNYLSELAFTCYSKNVDLLSIEEFEIFKKRYSKNYVISSHKIVEGVLTKAKILQIDNKGVRFTYRYLYYFYAAKYLSDHLESCESEVKELCEKLHKERNANILIFLTHHSKSSRILNDLHERATRIYETLPLATLDKNETSYLTDFVNETPELVIEHIDVEAERTKELKRLDEFEESRKSEEEIEEKLENAHDNLVDIHRSAKMIDVVGQILRNRVGSMPIPQLTDLARSGFGAGLRFLRFWLEISSRHERDFVILISRVLMNDPNIKQDTETLIKMAKRVHLRLAYDVCRGVITRISHSLGTNELLQVFEELERETPDSIAIKLINVSIELEFTKRIPKKKIEGLIKDLSSNPIGFMLLKELVLYHLYLNEVSYTEKQWIASKLSIPMSVHRKWEAMKLTHKVN